MSSTTLAPPPDDASASELFDGDTFTVLTSGNANEENPSRETAERASVCEGQLALLCPRCKVEPAPDLYGPCVSCVAELRRTMVLHPRRPFRASVDEDDTPTLLPAPPAADVEHVAAEGVTRPGRRAGFTPRRTLFLQWVTGDAYYDDGRSVHLPPEQSLPGLLGRVPADVERVMLCGQLPWGDVAELRDWHHVELPEPWREHERGHFVGRHQSPILRYTNARYTNGGHVVGVRLVEVVTAQSWLGIDDRSPAQLVREAFTVLASVLDEVAGMRAWLTTPATTGRNLWLRTVPDDGWPILPESLREELRTLAPQSRIETFPPPADQRTIGGLVEVDGRFMYGTVSICRAAPGGLPYRAKGEGDYPAERYLPARYRVAFTVPDTWAHVGLLPMRTTDGWAWPAVPGFRGETWCDGAELHVARAKGWASEVLERIVWPQSSAEPLRRFAEWIARGRREVARRVGLRLVEPAAGALARGCLRRILTDTIGGFASRTGYTVERWSPFDRAEPPADAIRLRVEGDGLAWEESAPNAASDQLMHPEWSHAVWSRVRARMLTGDPMSKRPERATGALHVPRGDLLAIGTDALYLTRCPKWALPVTAGGLDDGADGKLRHKASHDGPHKAPRNRSDVLRLLGGLRTPDEAQTAVGALS